MHDLHTERLPRGLGDGGALTGQRHRLWAALVGEGLRREATGVARAQGPPQDTPQHEGHQEHAGPATQQGPRHPRHVHE